MASQWPFTHSSNITGPAVCQILSNTLCSVYETVQQKFRDKVHGGWIEHCERDFTPLACTGERLPGMPDIVGFKSGDAHLHWMEALTELYSEVKDASVRESLLEAIELLCTKFYPRA